MTSKVLFHLLSDLISHTLGELEPAFAFIIVVFVVLCSCVNVFLGGNGDLDFLTVTTRLLEESPGHF